MWPFSRSKQTSVKKLLRPVSDQNRNMSIQYLTSQNPALSHVLAVVSVRNWYTNWCIVEKKLRDCFAEHNWRDYFVLCSRNGTNFKTVFTCIFFVSIVLVRISVLQCCAPQQYTSSCYLNVDIPIGQIPEGVVNVNYNKGCRNTNMIRFRMKPVGVLICGLKQSL